MYVDLQISLGFILDRSAGNGETGCAVFIMNTGRFPVEIVGSCTRGLRRESYRAMQDAFSECIQKDSTALKVSFREPEIIATTDAHIFVRIAASDGLSLVLGTERGDGAGLLASLRDHRSVSEYRRIIDAHRLCAEAMKRRFRIEFVGFSDAFLRLEKEIRIAARSGAPVLITGERGVGKECAAYAIHHYSARAAMPFVPVNCAALNRDLYLSELFGHCKGAFTGAETDREGKFQAAHRGTVFLDEIAELPSNAHTALLRALDHGEIQRVGSDRFHASDARVCAATNKDIDAMVAAGAFPADLFDRLNVFRITVPPLRERKTDIPLLLKYFSSQYCPQFRVDGACDDCHHSSAQRCLPDETMEILMNYHWPGNVRELKNVVLRSMARSSGRAVIFDPQPAGVRALMPETQKHWNYNDAVRRLFLDALEAVHWNKSAAARLLGLPLSTMIDRMKRHGVPLSRPAHRAENPFDPVAGD